MKARQLVCSVLLIGLLFSAAGCGGETPAETEDQANARYAVLVRLDRQNEVYDSLGRIVEDVITANDRAAEQARFQGFCAAANCFVRNDTAAASYEQAFQEDQRLRDTLTDLTSATAAAEMDTWQISTWSNQELEQLKDLLYALADCCDRGSEGTLAYQVSLPDLESPDGQAAMDQAGQLLLALNAFAESARTSEAQ